MSLSSKGPFILLRLFLINLIIITIFIKAGNSLKCRNDDGPSDGELKRVARSCMRKFSDSTNYGQNFPQQHQYQQQTESRHRPRVNYGYNYEDSSEDNNDDDINDSYMNNHRNYDHHQYGNSNNNNNDRSGNSGGRGGYNDERQRNRSRNSGNHNNRTNNGYGNNNNNNNKWNYLNQRNSNGNKENINYNNNNNNSNKNHNYNNNNHKNSSADAACIVHCFFEEMQMLNNNNYPDRHKMLYILTKDIRDREVRNFYTDTIQECFRYLETQKRRGICQFSRDLITCMTEYAKGNCDDWNEFNMMFN